MTSPIPFLAKMDDSTPGGAVFHLPFLLGDNDIESMQQVLEAAERHVSFLKLSSFFSRVAQLFPKGVEALSLQAQSQAEFGEDWVQIRVSGWARNEQGEWESQAVSMEESQAIIDEFPQALVVDIERKGIEFINKHAQYKTPEEFRSLAVEVWPIPIRTHIVADQLDASIGAAGKPSAPRPRM